ncbi:hypothetical protein G7046_g7597 [Stylonectria norvegica]|nr:hypothetical protein G7046_g7597 [Stylonectria norvegica]
MGASWARGSARRGGDAQDAVAKPTIDTLVSASMLVSVSVAGPYLRRPNPLPPLRACFFPGAKQQLQQPASSRDLRSTSEAQGRQGTDVGGGGYGGDSVALLRWWFWWVCPKLTPVMDAELHLGLGTWDLGTKFCTSGLTDLNKLLPLCLMLVLVLSLYEYCWFLPQDQARPLRILYSLPAPDYTTTRSTSQRCAVTQSQSQLSVSSSEVVVRPCVCPPNKVFPTLTVATATTDHLSPVLANSSSSSSAPVRFFPRPGCRLSYRTRVRLDYHLVSRPPSLAYRCDAAVHAII